MGAARTYQKRFERQAGQRLQRSLGDLAEASLPNDFIDLLRQADDRRKRSGDTAEASVREAAKLV